MVTAAHAREFLSMTSTAQRILIASHLNPDGDALGSALALKHYFEALGKQVEVLNQHQTPYNLLFLPGQEAVKQSPDHPEADVYVMVDLNNIERLGTVAPYFEGKSPLIVIDHHVPHTSPGDLRIVYPNHAATAEIITELLLELGADISPEIAQCLLTGIVTDTGSFRYRNSSPQAMHSAAMLLEKGGDIVEVCEEVYARKPLQSIKLLGRTLEKMQLAVDDQLAWAVLGQSDFVELGARQVHTEGLTNELLSIQTVQIAAVIREEAGGAIRASIRSREGHDISQVAKVFGGGGHVNAAGCTFVDLSLAEAESNLIREMKRCLEF